jgi:hypothetical protein
MERSKSLRFQRAAASVALLVASFCGRSEADPNARYADVGPYVPASLLPPPGDAQALLAAIQAAVAAGEAGYAIPTGTYNFSDTNFVVTNAQSFSLTAPLSVSEEQPSVVFLFAAGYGCILNNWHNSSFTGVTVDYWPVPFTQGTVYNVSRHSGSSYLTYELDIDAGYPDMSEQFYRNTSVATAKTIFWDVANRTMYHDQVAISTDVHNATLLSNGNWFIYTSMPSVLAGFTPPNGCLGTISPVTGDAIQCTNCSANTFTNMTLWASSAMGYLETSGLGGNVLTRWRNVRAPQTSRLLATNLDGIHSTSMSVGMTMTDSEISYAADDLFAVHCELGIAWGVPATSSSGQQQQQLYIIDTGGAGTTMLTHATSGSVLSFWALSPDMDPLGTAVVGNWSYVTNATLQAEAARAGADILAKYGIVMRPLSTETTLLLFQFTSPVAPAILPRYSSLVQFNGRCGSGTYVSNSYFHDTTGGLRIKGVNVTLTDITLYKGYGINMLPEVYWTQSISMDVTIENALLDTTGNAPNAQQSILYVNNTCPGLTLKNITIIPA